MNLKKNTPVGLILCFIMCFLLFSRNACAYGLIDTDRTAGLSVSFRPNGKNAANVEFRLYKAAEVSADCEFTLTDKFNAYPLSLDGLDNEGWRALAQTMAGYAASDGVASDFAAKTDSSGTVLFSGLDTGLYLVTGSSFTSGNYTYSPASFLVCLPNYGEDNAWQYDVTANVKFDSAYHGGGGGGGATLTRRVLKAWKNDGPEGRPESVSVTLLRDGKAYETVTLNEKNNWRYTWNGLNSYSDWQLVENDVPENYTVTESKEGITFLVTNTYGEPEATAEPEVPDVTGKPEKPDVTDKPDKPDVTGRPAEPDGTGKPEEPDVTGRPEEPENSAVPDSSGAAYGSPDIPQAPVIPSEPGNSDRPNIPTVPGEMPPSVSVPSKEPSVPEEPPSEKLPQTGMLWWPAPLLAVCGVIIFMIGWVKQRTDGEDDEK